MSEIQKTLVNTKRQFETKSQFYSKEEKRYLRFKQNAMIKLKVKNKS